MKPLTAAQLRVAECIGEGLSYAETAAVLCVSRDTVRAHVFAIVQKIPNPHGLSQKSAVQEYVAMKKAS